MEGNRLSNLELIYSSAGGRVQVFRCWDEAKKKPVCLKEQVCETIQAFNVMLKEGINQTSLLHPGICKLYECFLKQEGSTLKYAILMEWMDRDLEKEITERRLEQKLWSESDLLEIMFILVDALAYAQEQEICHRDITPHNIFINHSGSVKIGDFGSSSRHEAAGMFSTGLRGTPLYLSPAQRANSTTSEESKSIPHNPYKSDVYSLGITFVEMGKLGPPNHLSTLDDLAAQITDTIQSLPYTDTVKSILTTMLNTDEEQRPDFIDLREQFRNMTGFTPTEEALQQESRKGIFKKCVFCNKRLIQKAGSELTLVRLPCDPRNHVICTQTCFANYVRATTLDFRMELENVVCPKKKCKAPIPPDFTQANLPTSSPNSPSKATPLQLRRESSRHISVKELSPVQLSKTEEPPSPPLPPTTCIECDQPVDIDSAAECVRSGRELTSKPVVLSCNSQHVFCSRKCFLVHIRKQTNDFTLSLGNVICARCKKELTEDEVTALAGGKTQLERAKEQIQLDYVACNECKANKAQVTFKCGHGFCKMCIRGRYEVYRIQGKRNWLCPICKEPMLQETSVKSLCVLF